MFISPIHNSQVEMCHISHVLLLLTYLGSAPKTCKANDIILFGVMLGVDPSPYNTKKNSKRLQIISMLRPGKSYLIGVSPAKN